MSSRSTRLRTGFFLILAVVVSITVFAIQRSVCAAADKPVDVEGPAITTPERATSPENIPQPSKPTQPNKSAEPKEKKADAPDKNVADKDASKKDAAETYGDPLAPGKMKLLRDEIVAGINRRGIADRYGRFQNYAIGKVNSSAGRYTGSELAGNCRLTWYDHMMRNFLAAPAEAERFTREVHAAACDSHEGLAKVLAIAAVKLDMEERKPRTLAPPESAAQALDVVKQALAQAQVAYNAALAPLTKSEIQELQTYLVPVLCTQNQVGHTLSDRGTGRHMCDLMEKMDRDSMQAAADALAPLADPRLLEQLKSLPSDGDVKVRGVTGTVVARIETPAGAIIIGGKGENTYQLDEMRDIAVVIDLGGGNTYYEGTVGLDRPVLTIINLEGNNVFRGQKAGIQGGAVLGVSMLVNLGGNNTYEALDVAQGSAVAGVGILIDHGGNNRYRGIRRVQGQAIGGVGILIDRGGKNDYHAAMWAQGFGGPLGFGLLENVAGNNHYYCGGMWRDSYPETPGYEGWGQGVGAGIRQVADGGVGVILDGGGGNTYEFDYLSHGGGYWCGLGFARDFGGNSKRLITRTAYNGGPRTQPSFQRFGCGWGCHYAMGFCFTDAGDNVFEGTIMGSGMAWDCSLGALCYFGNGHNEYKATGGLTQGTGAQMGFGILFDYNGDDVYEGYGQGYASPSMTYHHMPECGGNFSFLVDYGGKDTYGCGAENNSYIERGDVGGFLIDRPQRSELESTATVPRSHTTDDSQRR
jgi:hypothetical protein